MAALVTPSPDTRPYQPFGSALTFLRCREDETMLSGPAGTGKSRTILEYFYALASSYPGCRLLFVRKTRESLTNAALVTWEEKVVPKGHPCLSNVQRRNRQTYFFPNGSVVDVGGMDKPTKIMSTEYDVIYCQEAIELTEEDWEALTTRLRNGVVPWQQITGDTNPDGPRHWIKMRERAGKLRLIESRHEDNPTVWDVTKNCPTPNGAKYLAKLNKLSGVRYKRLRLGLWVAADGLVYDSFDPHKHHIYRGSGDDTTDRLARAQGTILARHADGRLVKIGKNCRRIWTVDFGYNNPFVWQCWAESPDGDLYMLYEIYLTHWLVEDLAKLIKRKVEELGEPRPAAVICDHDAEDRATLARHLGIETISAFKAVTAGIQAVAARLGKEGGEDDAGNHITASPPRLFFLRGTLLHEPDARLREDKKPVCTVEELDSYVWDTSNGRKTGEEPVKQNDHGADAARYLVAYVDNIRNVDDGEVEWDVY